MTSLLETIETNRPDIITVTEIKPKNNSLPLSEVSFSIDNYQFYSNIDAVGRGIGVYIHNSICAYKVEITETFRESVKIRIKLSNSDALNLVCIYRSPNSSTENNDNFLNDFKDQVVNSDSHQLILGDFNLNSIDWNEGNCNENSNSFPFKFYEKSQDLFLHQHVKKHTRFRANQTPSLIDLIFSNEVGMIRNIEYQAPLWSTTSQSDHLVLVFEFVCYSETVGSSNEKFNYRKANFDHMRDLAKNTDWNEVLTGNSIDEVTKSFNDKINDMVKKCVPKSKVIQRKVGSRPVWMNNSGLKKIKKKHKSWQRYLNTKDGRDYQNYITARNETKSYLRKLNKDFEKDIAKNIKSDPKSFWKYVNSKTKTSIGINLLKDGDGNQIADNREKADLLNDFFSSIFTSEDENLPNIFPQPKPTHPPFSFSEITREAIRKKIAKLKPSKSPGPDNIHPIMLKELIDHLIEPLHTIFNMSINEGKVPCEWKVANVTPIFKKGSRLLPNNYRPVSLTSIICKLIESCIRDQVMTYLKNYDILVENQHGFRPSRSCVTQLLLIIDHWTKIIDNGGKIDNIYMDFSKAFDSVPHNRLLVKLQKYGFDMNSLNWFNSFLTDRKQRVCLSGEKSSWKTVSSGVPQGSVLGPILFLLYINDLAETTKCFVQIFADDTKLYSNVNRPDIAESLQSDINSTVDWSKTWQLPFNEKKCKVMHISKNIQPQTHDYYIQGENEYVKLESVDEERDLGVLFNKTLSFRSHINGALSKANQMLGIIKRGFIYLDDTSLTSVYKSIVRSHIEYANVIWRPHLKEDIRKIEKIQRRFTKNISSLSNLPYEERLRKLKLPSLEYRRSRADMIQTYKILHRIDDINPELIFQRDLSSRTRGHSLKLLKPHVKSNLRKYSFSVRIINDWNSLPNEVVMAESINSFKNRLDAFWKDKMYSFPF